MKNRYKTASNLSLLVILCFFLPIIITPFFLIDQETYQRPIEHQANIEIPICNKVVAIKKAQKAIIAPSKAIIKAKNLSRLIFLLSSKVYQNL